MNYDLELVKLSKTYADGTPAVIDVDLGVRKAEFVSLVGPSGCGKTTTLRMIAGFEAITSGDILLKNNNISALPPDKRPISTIFQNYALFPHMTVRENVGYGLRVRKISAAEIKRRVDAILERMGLDQIAGHVPARLSSGQRQRTALARGLVVEPDILLLDEPLGALDANLRKSIQQQMKLLQRDVGITFVFVTHAQSEALVLSDRVVVMNGGRIEQVDVPEQVYRRPATPFVAQFIGRNVVVSGRVSGRDGKVHRLDTAFGPLAGWSDTTLQDGAEGIVSISSSVLDVAPGSSPGTDATSIPARLLRRSIAGTSVQLGIALPDGREIVVESHVSKYPPGFASGPVMLQWKPEDATVIGARR